MKMSMHSNSINKSSSGLLLLGNERGVRSKLGEQGEI